MGTGKHVVCKGTKGKGIRAMAQSYKSRKCAVCSKVFEPQTREVQDTTYVRRDGITTHGRVSSTEPMPAYLVRTLHQINCTYGLPKLIEVNGRWIKASE